MNPFLLLLIFIASATSHSAPKLSAAVGFYGKNIESEVANSRLAGISVQALYDHKWIPEFHTQARLGVELESGTSQMRFSDELAAKQTLKLYHAEVAFLPLPEIRLSLGSLDQTVWENPLLLDSQSFPAALEKVKLPIYSSLFLTFTAEQAVANDTSPVGNWGTWPSRPATFFMERAGVSYEAESYLLSLYVSHFLFADLSSETAFKSRYLGNSVTGSFPSNSEFNFKFQGYEIGSQIQIPIYSQIQFLLSGSYLQNTSTSNNSVLITGGVTLWNWTPKVFLFSADRDTTPAFYNSKLLGHNNRHGMGASLTYQLPRQGMEGSLVWANAQLKNESSVQANQQWIQLNWKMNYDLL